MINVINFFFKIDFTLRKYYLFAMFRRTIGKNNTKKIFKNTYIKDNRLVNYKYDKGKLKNISTSKYGNYYDYKNDIIKERLKKNLMKIKERKEKKNLYRIKKFKEASNKIIKILQRKKIDEDNKFFEFVIDIEKVILSAEAFPTCINKIIFDYFDFTNSNYELIEYICNKSYQLSFQLADRLYLTINIFHKEIEKTISVHKCISDADNNGLPSKFLIEFVYKRYDKFISKNKHNKKKIFLK